MRSLYFTTADSGMTRAQLRHGEATGLWVRLGRGLYRYGPEPAAEIDRCVGPVVVAGGAACGQVAGVLLGFDSIALDGPELRRNLRHRRHSMHVAAADARGSGGGARRSSVGAGARVGAAEAARRVPGSSEPCRQVEVRNRHGETVAFVDFAWPELGLFIELDGQHHLGQPVHDARREPAVVAATGWLVGRFTWDEIVHHPVATARRLEELLRQAALRTSGRGSA